MPRPMGVLKKKTATVDLTALLTIGSVSKAALVDLVADLLRRNAGDEELNGEALAAAFVEAHEPIALLRGDKAPTIRRPPPPPPVFARKLSEGGWADPSPRFRRQTRSAK